MEGNNESQNNGYNEPQNNGESNGQYTNYQDNTANVPYQVPIENMPPDKANGLQTAGLICGIIAITTSCCYGIFGIILGIAGLICSILGNKDNKSGVGIAGLVCSIIGLRCCHVDIYGLDIIIRIRQWFRLLGTDGAIWVLGRPLFSLNIASAEPADAIFL